MEKTNKVLKLTVIFLTFLQAVFLMFWALNSYAYLAANISFIHIPNVIARGILRDYFAQGTIYRMIPVAVILPVFMFFLFQQIKVILKDMSKGTGFRQKHVKRIYVIALILAARGILFAVQYFYPAYVFWTGIVRSVLNGLFMGLIVFALAKIFEHGVEVQTDSDMTV